MPFLVDIQQRCDLIAVPLSRGNIISLLPYKELPPGHHVPKKSVKK